MKNKLFTISFIAFLLFFSTFHILRVDKDISQTERRKLAVFPVFELNSDYIEKVEKYLLDHFPFRDGFRSIKALFNYNVLNKLENNNIYLKDNYIFKSDYPTNKKSIENFIQKTNKMLNLLNQNNNVYIMIVPDKNYYLESDHFLNIDYNYLYNVIKDLNIEDIDIRNIMNLSDYYETDTHWKQEKLEKVVEKLSEKMDFKYHKGEYKKIVYNRFYGVYYGESALKREPENIIYLTNDTINNAKVTYLENKSLNKVYNDEKLYGLDSYEVYLDGASSFIEIFNHDCKNKKELIVFRDSFGSSLVPLLIEYYSKITVIDNRYISSEYFSDLIEFKNQDVLFLYSTLLINSSSTLKG